MVQAMGTEGLSCCGGSTPSDAEMLKGAVREKYARIATREGSTCCSDGYSMIGEAYDGVEGYVSDADLSLGCGVPTEFAGLTPGQTVLDLGSGAGLDVFVARREVGAYGRVIGVDATPEMVALARTNAQSLGYDNVAFHLGDIEAMPLEEAAVDVVLSNCVLNLVPDKRRAFAEMYRVLRPGGTFCISDVVFEGAVPAQLRRTLEDHVGCVAGAMEMETYLQALEQAGFTEVTLQVRRPIDVPLQVPEGAILSITVSGKKPDVGPKV